MTRNSLLSFSVIRHLSKSKKHSVRSYCSGRKNDVEVKFVERPSLTIGGSRFAQFTDGCAVAKLGETSVLVTAVSRPRPVHGATFLPLTVDYRQKAAAAGRIPTNFLRRETLPTDHEILVSRLIDRSLRPLFINYFCETQIICNILAVDGIHDPDILCINAASAALSLSDIPWHGPVGAVRVGIVNDKVVINPSRRELQESSLNLVVSAASQNLVIMLEASANNILQQDFLKAIKMGVKECQRIVSGICELQKTSGKKKRVDLEEVKNPLLPGVKSLLDMKLKEILLDFSHDKLSRDNAIRTVKTDFLEKMKLEQAETSQDLAAEAFDLAVKEVFRNLILDNDMRCDGRGMTQLRNIITEVNLFKPVPGSAFFQRGQTQVLCKVSLDSLNSVLHMDPMSTLITGLKEKNFFLHYEFPPYAVNEIGKVGPAQRREVGHGALAERALRPVIPPNFPFTIRLTSEVLQSNGSSSMATVCGGSMALFDAGVPLQAPAAGVAIGLVTRYEGNDTKHIEKYKLLTDILGIEDYMGDMDFKLAGTKKGITALQADIKIPGLPLKIVMEAVQASCEAKSEIIDIMNSTISKPRADKKSSWPVTENIDIPVNKRGRFVGPGGINLKRLLVNTGVQVTFDDIDGLYRIFAPNEDAMDEAKEQIKNILTSENEPILEFGAIYTAKIVELKESGVMVTLYDSMRPALVHNSQLDQRKVSDPRVLGLDVGQEIKVKYFGLDPVSGQMRLSRKVLTVPASNVPINMTKS